MAPALRSTSVNHSGVTCPGSATSPGEPIRPLVRPADALDCSRREDGVDDGGGEEVVVPGPRDLVYRRPRPPVVGRHPHLVQATALERLIWPVERAGRLDGDGPAAGQQECADA